MSCEQPNQDNNNGKSLLQGTLKRNSLTAPENAANTRVQRHNKKKSLDGDDFPFVRKKKEMVIDSNITTIEAPQGIKVKVKRSLERLTDKNDLPYISAGKLAEVPPTPKT